MQSNVFGQSASPSVQIKAVLTPGQTKPSSPLEVELLTIGPGGFETKQIKRKPGPFFLLVKNVHPNLSAVSLNLVSQAGSKAADLPASHVTGTFDVVVDLPVGNYQLVEASHPTWKIAFVIGN